MKKLLTSTLTVALMGFAVGCGDDDSSTDNGGTTNPGGGTTEWTSPVDHPNVSCSEVTSGSLCKVTGSITSDLTLTKSDDITWLLEGPVFVGNDADATTLTVDAGVTVYASTAVQDTLLCVTRGAKIEAEGAADAPIVFTPDNDTGVRGQWGGLIINGKSHLNKSGGVAQGEGNTGEYGGGESPDLEDNSGTLKYVRVEYAGRLLTTEDELNGIAFQAVGSGTTVDYVQVHMNKDDGIEWFGGTVNVKHIFVTGIADDSFDWTAGWTGKGQFMIAQQYVDAGDRMIEADNSGSDNDALPRSKPTLSNVTLVGQGLDGAGDTGILLREGTAANISNAVVFNASGACLDIDQAATYANAFANGAYTGELSIANSFIYNCKESFKSDDDSTATDVLFTLQDWFGQADWNNAITDPKLTDATNVEAPDFTPASGSPLLAGAAVPADSFFEAVDYVGAMGSDNWLAGWSRGSIDPSQGTAVEVPLPDHPNVACTELTSGSNLCKVTGTLTESLSMKKADNITWLIEGPVFVGNDADETVLSIDPGVTVFASTAVQDTLLCVTRGSKINAVGSQNAPIVFTPDNDTGVRGQWGGLIINGKSHLNKSGGVAQGEGNTGEYGGGESPDLEDNSGTLKYVRVEYAGRLLTTEDELNGIALQAVGSGTTIDYVQVHMNKDDGIEWFGGTVNVKHILVTGIADDSFDWTAGWTGKGQFMIAQQYADDGDRMIEADNSGSNNDALPRSNPTLSNLTLVGQGADGAGDTGILLREGTGVSISNAIVFNASGACLDIDQAATYANAYADGAYTGNLTIANSYAFGCSETFKSDSDSTADDVAFTIADWYGQADWANAEVDPGLTTEAANEANPDFAPAAGAAVLSGGVVPADDFFEDVDFVGAVGADDWTANWTRGR